MAKPLGDFSSATSDTTTTTSSVLSVVQAVDQDSQAIEAAKNPPASLKEKDVHPIFGPNDLLQRQLALQSLATYAATLKSLSGVDRSGDIQKSFDSLKTSIDASVNTINELATDSKTKIPSGVVSGLVSLGGNLVKDYAAHEREKAIRFALERSDATVAKICGLLADELSPGMPKIYDQLETDYGTQEEAADKKYKSARASALAEADSKLKDETKTGAPATPPDLTPYFKSFAVLKAKKDYSLALLKSLASAYHKIAEAHNALKIQSETGVKSSPQLRALSSEIDNAKFLYSQIPK